MCNHKVSCWEKASTVATFLELLVVVVSLWFIGYQLQQQQVQLDQQVKLSRAANTQTLVDLITPLNLKVTDRGMAELWVKKDGGIDKVSDVKEREIQKEQYWTLIASYMIFYENAYSQFRAGLLDEDIYARPTSERTSALSSVSARLSALCLSNSNIRSKTKSTVRGCPFPSYSPRASREKNVSAWLVPAR